MRKPSGSRTRSIEVLETVEHLGHRVPDPVVVLDVPAPRGAAGGQRGLRDPGDDRRFRHQVRRGGLLHPDREVHHAHRVLDRGGLDPGLLVILLGTAQARQDQGATAVDHVTAVEFGAHLHGEITFLQTREGVRGVRGGTGEIAAHPDEHLDLVAVHGLDGVHGVHSVLARRVDTAHLGEPVEEGPCRPVVDTAGAVALHIAVPPHR